MTVLDVPSATPSPAPLAPTPAAEVLDRVVYDNRIVRDFVAATILWGIVGMLVGVWIALELCWPRANTPWALFAYGRLRPLHTNAVVFAFAGNAIFAGAYYAMQRLLKTGIPWPWLARFHFWGWQAIIVAAAITLPLGITTSKEYAELEWPIKIAIAVVWIAFGGVMAGMIWHRRERHLYVAIWFFIATWIAIAMLHIVNGLAIPVSLWKSYPVYAGVQDALVQWWYGHNAVAFFLTTPFLGLMYYYLPKAAGRPVYSYRLSIAHFWSLIFIYIWAGPHHLLNSALPEWAQTLGVMFSVMLIAPSWGGMLNGLLTLRGAYHRVAHEPVLKFFLGSLTFYGVATLEGCILSLRDVNALSHDTDWTIAHVHSGSLGWVGMMVFGMVYWMVPRLYQRPLWSPRLATTHFWMAFIGLVVYIGSLYTAGIIEGVMQLAFDDHARLAYRDFMQVVVAWKLWYWVRLWGGATYLVGTILCAINCWKTARSAAGVADEAVLVPPRPPEEILAPLTTAIATPGGAQRALALHRLVERWPAVLVVLAAVAVSIGGICEIIPSMIEGVLTPRIASVTPYTPLELAGRDLYIREGCSNCHTQLIRTLRAETERYGPYTRPGEGIYDRPFLWGSKRTGPDLAREGVSRPSALWQWLHLINPRAVTPGSIMPSYPWLATASMDLSDLSARMQVLADFPACTPYRRDEIAHAPELARAQAAAIAAELRQDPSLKDHPEVAGTEAVALIAYLRRLGVDLTRPPPTTIAARPAAREEHP